MYLLLYEYGGRSRIGRDAKLHLSDPDLTVMYVSAEYSSSMQIDSDFRQNRETRDRRVTIVDTVVEANEKRRRK